MRRLSHPVCLVSPSRASARKRANTGDETSTETNPGPPKTRNRPYDGRPRSGWGHTTRPTPRGDAAIHVILPNEPPRLTPSAAAALLRILIKAHDRLTQADSEQGADQ